jgi:hypothetical protein
MWTRRMHTHTHIHIHTYKDIKKREVLNEKKKLICLLFETKISCPDLKQLSTTTSKYDQQNYMT